MFAEERYQVILNLLDENASVKVSELTEYFGVSESTIRRDLQDMEEKGMLSRTHGGAVKSTQTRQEPSFQEKEDVHHTDKEIIGKLAASMVHDGESILLDSGTTTLEMAKHLTAKNLTVLTNSMDVATSLSGKEGIDVILTGGNFRNNTRSMVGPICDQTLRQFKPDKVFLGTNGITRKDGMTTPNLVEATTKRTMLLSGKNVYILADPSKFGTVHFSVFGSVKEVTAVITTNNLGEEIQQAYQEMGIKLIQNDSKDPV